MIITEIEPPPSETVQCACCMQQVPAAQAAVHQQIAMSASSIPLRLLYFCRACDIAILLANIQ